MKKLNVFCLFMLGLLMTASSLKAQEEIFKVVEQMPRFPGCEEKEITDEQKKNCANEKMFVFIKENLSYPKAAKETGIEGTVVAQFVVLEDGAISDVQIVRGIGGGCDEEVKRLVESMPAWLPGMQRGRTVKVQMNLPVRFKLPEEKTDDK